jgi:hypothetical protein
MVRVRTSHRSAAEGLPRGGSSAEYDVRGTSDCASVTGIVIVSYSAECRGAFCWSS